MLPGVNDPKWVSFVKGSQDFGLTNLAARMLANRLKLQTSQDGSPETIKKSVQEAYDFFKQNEAMTEADIKKIFG